MRVHGYGDIRVLHDGVRTTILQARRLADGRSVVLKQARTPFPSPAELSKLQRELDITRKAAGPEVVEAYGMFTRDGTAWLELESCPGGSLEELRASRALSLEETLTLALELVSALEHVHRAGLVHKDLNPSNVLLDEGGHVKLTDFGLAGALTVQAPLRADRLEGTPSYMSPEQTGRLNRAIDWRSDYYSLGATLYHLLTGAPPFSFDDPIETAYAHIARRPVPPNEVNPAIPEPLSAIVMTLLAKRADDRYQSAQGLRHDLERCLRELRATGRIEPFALRAEDRSETLQIPETLYGRGPQVDELNAALGRAARGGREALFVTGAAGAGKTALIGEIHQGLALYRAVMVSCKFEQFQREVPYASVLRGLRQLIHQLLGLPPSRVEAWRAKIAEALADTGGVLSESLPELELLVGAMREPPVVSALEAENRFLDTLVRLVSALPSAGPAVLFLDDLQWADPSSVALLEKLLLDPSMRRVLLIGSYRSNEVDEGHPLLRALGRARELGARVTSLELSPLSLDDVRAMLSETLARPKNEIDELARLAHVWTGGNPFLLHRLIEGLASDSLLRREGGRWAWDIGEISRRGLGEAGAGFVAGRLSELPERTRKTLEVASCVGATFSTSTLAEALGTSRVEIRASLLPALELRLVHPLQEGFWPEAAEEIDFDFAFSHDRIQEAAHARLTEDQQREVHLRVGRQLLAHGSSDVFEVVHHLNLAVGLLSEGERQRLLRLDAEAGRRALRSGAFAPALQLIEQAVALLPAGAWASDRGWAYALLLDAARAGYLSGASDRMDAHLAVALSHAETPLDRVAALEIRALDRAGRDLLEAVDVALSAMSELGVSLPRRPQPSDVEAAMGAVMKSLTDLGLDKVAELPELADPTAAALVQLANSIMAPAYLAVPLLLPMLAAAQVGQTLEKGVTPSASYGYAILSLVLTAGGALGPGEQLARLCLRLMERFHDRGQDARPGHVVMGHVLPFTLPIREAVERHRPYLARALAAGDHEYAMWIAHLSLANAFYAGLPLEALSADLEREAMAMRRLGQRAPLDCTEPFEKLVATLVGQRFSPARLGGDEQDEETKVATLLASGSRGAVYVLQTQRLFLRFLLRDLEGALSVADQGEPYEDGAVATYHPIVFRQTLSLVCAQLAGRAKSEGERARLLARARESRARLEAPSAHAPHNHAHRLRLIDAEIARVEGDALSAIDAYDEAIALARQNEFTHEEALANELCGRFHLERGRLTPARAYLLEACSAYGRWGASAKLRQLEAELPELVVRSGPSSTRSVTVNVSDVELDLATLSKSTLAITSEIRTDRLVERVLSVSIQSAGATRGLLLLERDGALKLAASEGEGFPPPGTPLSQLTGAPLSILQYVARTGSRLVVPDARTDPRFASDRALSRARPLSVLALPLTSMGRSSGVIYLENDLTADAFPQSRTQLLEMLGAQAAISLENARLYGEAEALTQRLQARVRDRSRELSAALERLAGGGSERALLPPGTVLSEQVRILGLLGAGGMGVVYVGEDLRTRERVAVKVVLGSLLRDDSESMRRFLRESHSAASVSHPAVARTLAVDVSAEGLIFQVQELVDGEPLKRVLERYRTLPSGEAARLGAVLASGLSAAHEKRIVHRDIKPSNVMLTTTEPGLKLLDFGIARVAGDDDDAEGRQHHESGQLVGTPDYMAPEQFLTPHRVSVAVDVYALGLLLYRALSGRLPEQRVDLIRRAVHDPAALTEIAPSVSPELGDLVMACLSRDPAQRPSSERLCHELGAIADAARTAPLSSLTSRWVAFVREHTSPPETPEAMAVTLTTMSDDKTKDSPAQK